MSRIQALLRWSLADTISLLCRRTCTTAYSWWVAHRFGRRGRGLTIGFPCMVYHPRAVAVGDGVTIKASAWLNCEVRDDRQPSLTIGEGSCLGRFVHINARASVTIEPYVLFAERVFVTDYSHRIDDARLPILQQPLTEVRPVRICAGAWIGEGAIIMPGVTIGRNAVVGANAVVTRDVPERHVAVGVPARTRPIGGVKEREP